MPRFAAQTKTHLINTIEEVNAALEASGSDYRYRQQSRNGYNAVDLYRLEGEAKKWMCVSCLDCAEPPRVLIDRVNDDFEYYLGRKWGDRS